jgi:hypothetical protein
MKKRFLIKQISRKKQKKKKKNEAKLTFAKIKQENETTLRRSNPLVRSTNKNQEENNRIQKIKVQGLERTDL